jgi:hypothetical protein
VLKAIQLQITRPVDLHAQYSNVPILEVTGIGFLYGSRETCYHSPGAASDGEHVIQPRHVFYSREQPR